MKMLLLPLLCAVGCASGGAVGWPGAALLRTIIPPQTKTVAYSTSQYINSLPYSFGPQVAYQFPSISAFSPLHSGYYPLAGPSYLSPGNAFYPLTQLVPGVIPAEQPASITPNLPPPQQGDSDSAVVDSAEFAAGQRQPAPSTEAPSQPQPQNPQFPPVNGLPSFEDFIQKPDASNFPQSPQSPQGFPQIPQFPPSAPQIPQQGLPQVPQFPPSAPQIPQQGLPQVPQFPPSAPQIPQQGFPQIPQFPTNPPFPQAPSPPPSSFPSADREDKGLNDEDTISVESA